MRRLDKDMIFFLGIISLLISISITFIFLFAMDIKISQNNMSTVLCGFTAIATLSWGYLLCRNC